MSTPPPVQMLWERVDPEATLLDRFGHDDFEAVARWVEGVLDVHYGIATSPVSLRSLIGAWIEQAPLAAPAAAVALLRRLVEAAPDDAGPRHLVHGDHRAANILVRDGDVVAVLDFEEARIDQSIAELARSAVLLGTRAGYEAVRPLTAAESARRRVRRPAPRGAQSAYGRAVDVDLRRRARARGTRVGLLAGGDAQRSVGDAW